MKAKNDKTRTVLITGCSSGIGYDAAHRLRNRDWHVVASCRQEADCERLREEGFTSPRLDYADESSIESTVAATLAATNGRLDALFNNGAFAIPGAIEDVPRQAMREIFETNFFGYHDLTCRILPTMRRQGFGRIVNCSSILGFITLPLRGPYNATKFALEGLTDTLRLELRQTGIHVVLIEPGPITTRIRENSRPHFEKWVNWKQSPYLDHYREKLIPHLSATQPPKVPFELPPEAVTRKLIHALESPHPKPRYLVTTPTYIAAILKRVLPATAVNRLFARAV
ncbi:MAG: SDR family NAD(P)-dependent oxidoreductase [Rhodobacteraceae bacterium]|nr:SDR family NAD(P)-dependent oxidoreductase [Paracoccaceae bacterium]MCY4195776.1 SDR family NAD(P)-dependent oxidoreductase [Paracoccaceae bacterium]